MTYADQYRFFVAHTNQKYRAADLLSRRSYLWHNKSILDVGSADGKFLSLICESVRPRCIKIIEPNNELSNQALLNLPNSILVGKNITQILPTIKFDTVLAAHVLYHIPSFQLRKFISDCIRVINPGGYFVVVLQNDTGGYIQMIRYLGGRSSPVEDFFRAIRSKKNIIVLEASAIPSQVICRTWSDSLRIGKFMVESSMGPVRDERIAEAVKTYSVVKSGQIVTDCSQIVIICKKSTSTPE